MGSRLNCALKIINVQNDRHTRAVVLELARGGSRARSRLVLPELAFGSSRARAMQSLELLLGALELALGRCAYAFKASPCAAPQNVAVNDICKENVFAIVA